ncbi:hypothetical protein A2572_01100 [Candidatus Collierbacteria bacterium RIFOXYD1_FULL_40_9]|uniref:SCP domain-containing protein n=1 Tax=Candidatus Collierbacteria bacterium RIFOXYD1_FULL_40_9 TaxID=1817731 RepID=A0A1F5FP55_9BACT|nr:MAG: hypothetical protein A2572_01100 [Candidatus Collierbacteria bacterium RIFOXYD1_FULL_40_9]
MIRKILILGLAASTAIYVWQLKQVNNNITPLYDQVSEYVARVRPTPTKYIFPEETKQTILAQINTERSNNKLKELTLSEDLSKAAKARAAVIFTLDDFTGTVSGLTREKAYDLVGYETSYFGDLVVNMLTPSDDFMSEINQNKQKKEMILLDKFTEVGVAEFVGDTYNSYYLLFGNRKPKTNQSTTPKAASKPKVTWGGPELWEAVNKRRVEFGVNKLTRKDELCTIASIRLNQLLDLNKLDGHAGFKPVLDRSDLKWISEKYNISEFLAQGYSSPEETVKGWENTLGHRGLLTGGEYVWGCVYAQNSFAVAISAY